MKSLMLLVAASLLLAGCNTSPELIGKCPQPRLTGQAPDEFYHRENPLAADADTVSAGRRLYMHSVSDNHIACARCHGRYGDGVGPLSHMFDPPPRNFTCASAINGVPDGQLFWIIRHGSPGTSMPGFDTLSDDQVWSLIIYIRKLANAEYDS